MISRSNLSDSQSLLWSHLECRILLRRTEPHGKPRSTAHWPYPNHKWIDRSISYAVHLGTVRIIVQFIMGEIRAEAIKEIDMVILNLVIFRGKEWFAAGWADKNTLAIQVLHFHPSPWFWVEVQCKDSTPVNWSQLPVKYLTTSNSFPRDCTRL